MTTRIDLDVGCLLEAVDFRETLRIAAEIGGADLVLTSPPYDDARTYDAAVSWTFADYQALGDSIFAALVPGGHALVVLDSPVREWRKGKGTERGFTPWRVMLDWAERVGFRVPDRLAYCRLGSPGRYEGRFRNDWEPLLWFQKPGARGFFDKDPIARPMDQPYGQKRKPVSSRKRDGTMYERVLSGSCVERNVKQMGTAWEYGNVSGATQASKIDHPAQFALPFAEDAVRCFCPPQGLVVDPFLGSGTSAVAAIRHGRFFLGGDLLGDKQGVSWARRALERIERDRSTFVA